MKIKIGLPTLMEYQSVIENLELAKELDLDFIELNMNMTYCFPKPEFRYKMLRYKQEYQIDFTMHYYDTVDVSSPNPNYQEYLFKDIRELAKNLEGIISRLILHIEPGAFMTIHSEKKYVYRFDSDYEIRTIDNLSKIRNILAEYDIELMLENVPIHPFMENLYKELGKYEFNFCWDIGHDVIYNDYLFSLFKEKHQLRVKHMHMHNVAGLKDHQELQVGDLDIPSYIDFAVENDLNVVVEVKDSENLKSSVQYIKEYLHKYHGTTIQKKEESYLRK